MSAQIIGTPHMKKKASPRRRKKKNVQQEEKMPKKIAICLQECSIPTIFACKKGLGDGDQDSPQKQESKTDAKGGKEQVKREAILL